MDLMHLIWNEVLQMWLIEPFSAVLSALIGGHSLEGLGTSMAKVYMEPFFPIQGGRKKA